MSSLRRTGSLQRRAVALAALVQLSSTCNLFMILFKDLLRKGLIPQYNELIESAKINTEEKMQFIVLSDLAGSTASKSQYYPPSFEFVHWLRQKLFSVIYEYMQVLHELSERCSKLIVKFVGNKLPIL